MFQNLWIQVKPRNVGVEWTIIVSAFQIFSPKKS